MYFDKSLKTSRRDYKTDSSILPRSKRGFLYSSSSFKRNSNSFFHGFRKYLFRTSNCNFFFLCLVVKFERLVLAGMRLVGFIEGKLCVFGPFWAYYVTITLLTLYHLFATVPSTSGRLHSEFVRLLFLQAHRETDRFFYRISSSTSGT